MEKHGAGIVAKSKFKFLMLLPKPTSTSATAVNLHNQNHAQNQYLFSPGKVFASKMIKSHNQGPITSIVFQEARNKSSNPGSSSRFTKEPTSPKISCMGQIKNRKKNKNHIKNKKDGISNSPLLGPKKQKSPVSRNPFRKQGKKSESQSDAESLSKLPDRAPSLSQMKRFASARETLYKFDYNKAQIGPENRDPGYNSDQSSEEDEDERQEPMIPFSAPILRGDFEGGCSSMELRPRNEINLWKRRTMVQPKPLQLH